MKSRQSSHLQGSLERSLRSYALAATATGVGAVALVQPAEARIVYKPLHKFVTFPPLCVSFDNNAASVCWGRFAELSFTSLAGGLSSPNAVVAQLSQDVGYGALALPPGAKIGPAQPFEGYGKMAVGLGSSSIKWFGQWANGGKGVKNHYFGFRFKGKDAKLHYGWARMTVTITKYGIGSVLVSGLAYETIPNKPIIAGKTKGTDDGSVEQPDAAVTMPTPEPATLGALAMGSLGLSIWKRDGRVAVDDQEVVPVSERLMGGW